MKYYIIQKSFWLKILVFFLSLTNLIFADSHLKIHPAVKGTLSGLRQFLAIESVLKMMKSDFYFTSKVFFVLKIFKFLSWVFGHAKKQLD